MTSNVQSFNQTGSNSSRNSTMQGPWSNSQGPCRPYNPAYNAYYNAYHHQQWSMYWWNIYNCWQLSQQMDQEQQINCECDEEYERQYDVNESCECYQNHINPQIAANTVYSHSCNQHASDGMIVECNGVSSGYHETTSCLDCCDQDVHFHCNPPLENRRMPEETFYVNEDVHMTSRNNTEEEDIHVEMDEGFKTFLEQSAKHRKERDKKKRESARDSNEYIEVGTMKMMTSTLPPDGQPGMKRKEEMEKIYGHKAPLITSLETSLQLHYDRNCDIRQPVFWPSIPLKF